MPDALTFLMGKHPAHLPGELLYCKNHMWCRPGAGGVCTFGFSAYAVRLMQDVYFLEWRTDPGLVTLKQEIGYIETQKATSGLYAPVAGKITRFNPELLNDPSAINADGYGNGWLFEMECDAAGTLDVAAYYAHLEAGWEATQRMLKGQLNAIDDE
jgi:glycine cleavage system H protein